MATPRVPDRQDPSGRPFPRTKGVSITHADWLLGLAIAATLPANVASGPRDELAGYHSGHMADNHIDRLP